MCGLQLFFSCEKRESAVLSEISGRRHKERQEILRTCGIGGREEEYGRIELQAVILAGFEMVERVDFINVDQEHVSFIDDDVLIRHGRRKPAADSVNDLNKIMIMRSDLTAGVPII